MKLAGYASALVGKYHLGGPANNPDGFRTLNDSTADWHDFWGVRFDVKTSRDTELTITITAAGNGVAGKSVRSVVRLTGEGWHTVALPWSAFSQFSSRRA